jgi:hypothetical protein
LGSLGGRISDCCLLAIAGGAYGLRRNGQAAAAADRRDLQIVIRVAGV